MSTRNPRDGFLARIQQELHENFGIEHTTIRVETGNFLLPVLRYFAVIKPYR